MGLSSLAWSIAIVSSSGLLTDGSRAITEDSTLGIQPMREA